MTGHLEVYEERNRATPYHFPHSTQVAGVRSIHGGEHRFYNNIFVRGYPQLEENKQGRGRNIRWLGYGLEPFGHTSFVVLAAGNVYLNGAKPHPEEKSPLVLADADPDVQLRATGGRVELILTVDARMLAVKTPFITTEFLGKTLISGLPFENPDGSPLVIDRDYFGRLRSRESPAAGPFEDIHQGRVKLTVWPQ